MAETDCPDRETLEVLLIGKLLRGRTREFEEHLLNCDNCSQVAKMIEATDDSTKAFPSKEESQSDEEVLAYVIKPGKRLCSQIEANRPEETQAIARRETKLESDVPAKLTGEAESLDQEIDFLHPPEQPDEIGRLGDYRVLDVLGAGGMGVVFRAEDPKLERLVALKVMKPVVAASRFAKDRFLREAKANAAIEHHNIVSIYQVGEDRNVPFIVMQFLRGESLQKRLSREGRLDDREVLRIGREVAEGLAAIHKQGVVHRDIKPDNVWLEEDCGRAKILDFGLARTHDEDSGLTQTDIVLGTPKYMSPEQARGEPLDHRCDLFSLGSVLYHLASGKPPFEGRSLFDTLIAASQIDCLPIKEVRPDVHPDLAKLITGLMSEDRNDRPQTATEVAGTLAAMVEKLDAELAEQAKH